MNNVVYGKFWKWADSIPSSLQDSQTPELSKAVDWEITHVETQVDALVTSDSEWELMYDCYPVHEFGPYIATEIPKIIERSMKELQISLNKEHQIFLKRTFFTEEVKKLLEQQQENYAFIIKWVFDFSVNYQEIIYEPEDLQEALDNLLWEDAYQNLYDIWEQSVHEDWIWEKKVEEDDDSQEIAWSWVQIIYETSDTPVYDTKAFLKNINDNINKVLLEVVTNFNTKYPHFKGVQKNENEIERYLWETKDSMLLEAFYIMTSFEYLAQTEDEIKFDDIAILTYMISQLEKYKTHIIWDLYEICNS